MTLVERENGVRLIAGGKHDERRVRDPHRLIAIALDHRSNGP